MMRDEAMHGDVCLSPRADKSRSARVVIPCGCLFRCASASRWCVFRLLGPYLMMLLDTILPVSVGVGVAYVMRFLVITVGGTCRCLFICTFRYL